MYIIPQTEVLKLNTEHLKAITDKTKSIAEKMCKHEPQKRSKYLKKCYPFTEDIV